MSNCWEEAGSTHFYTTTTTNKRDKSYETSYLDTSATPTQISFLAYSFFSLALFFSKMTTVRARG
jgi:hypothetical protein